MKRTCGLLVLIVLALAALVWAGCAPAESGRVDTVRLPGDPRVDTVTTVRVDTIAGERIIVTRVDTMPGPIRFRVDTITLAGRVERDTLAWLPQTARDSVFWQLVAWRGAGVPSSFALPRLPGTVRVDTIYRVRVDTVRVIAGLPDTATRAYSSGNVELPRPAAMAALDRMLEESSAAMHAVRLDTVWMGGPGETPTCAGPNAVANCVQFKGKALGPNDPRPAWP